MTGPLGRPVGRAPDGVQGDHGRLAVPGLPVAVYRPQAVYVRERTMRGAK